ncbi:sugar transferase [Erysipelothrix larvae]|nr:sugar transferase [Erysipelothrix larvae]
MNRTNTVLKSEYDEIKYENGDNFDSFENLSQEIGVSFLFLFIKRVIDLILSAIFLVPSLLIVLLTGLAVKLDSKGPILFKQERFGKDGESFTIFKIRTMSHAPLDKSRDMVWTTKNDCRITKVGKIIRKIRFDELPQVINVIKGEMSFVGPRPETIALTNKFNQTIPGFYKRLAVKPGITGLAQVNGGYDLNPKEKLAYDLKYINDASLWLDLKILFMTFKVIFFKEGAR